MLEKTVAAIERVSGLLLLAVALLTFAMVILRKFFDAAIPDWYDFSRLLQGLAVLWGIACACHRANHIQVDLVWDQLTRAGQRRLDLFAGVALLAFLAAFAAMAMQAGVEMRGKHLLTSDLRIPQWGFYVAGALGVCAAVWATLVRLRDVWRNTAPPPSATGGDTG